MPSFKLNKDTSILVEFPPTQDTATPLTPEEHRQQSATAINNAMNTIRNMAQLVVETMDTLPQKPAQVDVEFSLDLTPDGNATLVKPDNNPTLNITLTWDNQWLQDDELPNPEHPTTTSQSDWQETPDPYRPTRAPQPDWEDPQYRPVIIDPPEPSRPMADPQTDWNDDDDEDWI